MLRRNNPENPFQKMREEFEKETEGMSEEEREEYARKQSEDMDKGSFGRRRRADNEQARENLDHPFGKGR